MDADENARTTPHGRMPIVARLAAGWTVAAVAAAPGTSARTVRKCRDRFAAEGAPGCATAPADHTTARRECPPRHRPRSGRCGVSASASPPSPAGPGGRSALPGTRCAVSAPDGPRRSTRQVIRCGRERPGELIHLDARTLGRIDGIGHRIPGERTGQSRKRGTGWSCHHNGLRPHSARGGKPPISRLARDNLLQRQPGRHPLALNRAAIRTRMGLFVQAEPDRDTSQRIML